MAKGRKIDLGASFPGRIFYEQWDLSIDLNSAQPSGQISLRSSFMRLQLFSMQLFLRPGSRICPQISPTDSNWISPKISIVIKYRLALQQVRLGAFKKR